MPYRYLKRTSDSSFIHVYNRGSNKMPIFRRAGDYRRFIDRLVGYSEAAPIECLAYCLMPNHYHLLLREQEVGAVARLIQRLCVSYAMYFKAKYSHSGHVFQGPYGERVITSDEDLVNISAYIHNNPASLGCDPNTYPWSSLPAYLDPVSNQNPWLSNEPVMQSFNLNHEGMYLEFLQGRQTKPRDQVSSLKSRPGLQ